MKLLLTYCKALSTIGFILGLAVLMSYKPAIAGHWVISYEYHGSASRSGDSPGFNGTFPWTDSNNVIVTVDPWVEVVIGGVSASANDSVPEVLTSSGTLCAVLTWTPDVSGDASLPPNQVSISETVGANAYSLARSNPLNLPTSVSVSDSFGDPKSFISDAAGPYSGSCGGSHIVTMPVTNNQATVKFPPVAVNASITICGGQIICRGRLIVKIVAAGLRGYSTHCAPALGGSDPNWTPAAPRYFSGTGCQAQGTAVAASGYLTHAQLLVGDTVVKEYWDTNASGEPNPVPTDGSVSTGTNLISANLNALFDSTHFISGAMVVLKMKVWDSAGGYYDGQIQAPAKNRMYAYGDQTPAHSNAANVYAQMLLDDIFEHIQSDATSMNYYQVTTREDAKPAVLSTIPSYTAIYVDSHGFTNSIGDCFAMPDSGDDHYLDFVDIGGAIAVKSQNLNLPPYNFVFLDCCLTAGDPTQSPPLSTNLASAFLLGNYSGSLSGLSDRGFIGWKNTTLGIGSNARWTDNFNDNLALGYTMSDAALYATLTFPELGPITETIPFPLKPIFPEIYGDAKTKMCTVYGKLGGVDGGPGQWYRPL